PYVPREDSVNQQVLRPEAPTHEHWWRRVGEIASALMRIDKRDSAHDDPALYIDERTPLTNGLQVGVLAQSTNPVVVTSIITYSQNASATLNIGDRSIPVPQGLFVFSDILMFVNEALTITLTTTISGSMFLE